MSKLNPNRIAVLTATVMGTAALLVPSAALASKDKSRTEARSHEKISRDVKSVDRTSSIDRPSIDAPSYDR